MDRREIQDFPGYWVYEDGRIWSDPKPPANPHGKFLTPKIDQDGYWNYALRRDCRSHWKRSHRLVLEAFVGPCPDGFVCRHLDGDPQNNHVSNLCWGTVKENVDDKRRHGTLAMRESHGRCRLSQKEVEEIRCLLDVGIRKQCEIAVMFGVSDSQISRIKYRRQWA